MDDQGQDPDYVDVEDSSSVEDVTRQYSARGRGSGGRPRRRSRLAVPLNQYSFHKDQDTLSDIEANRKAFILPERFAELGYTVQPLPRRTSSIAHLYGIKLVPTESSRLNPVWKCLFTNCFENDKCIKLGKGTTANATGHLFYCHGIQSSKTLAMKENRRQHKTKTHVNKGLRTDDPQRFYSLAITKLIIRKNLPLDVGETKEIAMIAGEQFRQIRAEVVKRCLLEYYLHIKGLLKAELRGVQDWYKSLPFLQLAADVYKNSLLNKSFLGLRIAFVDPKFYSIDGTTPAKSFNLAIRGFQPSFDDRNSSKLSDLLYSWTRDILNDYELSTANVLTATTDGGSDIKRLIEKKLFVAREWCLPHLIHLAVQDAFGVSARSKNNIVAHITKDMRRVIEFVNKSPKVTQRLREAQEAELGQTFKLVNFAHQRWTSASRMYRGFLRSFSIIHEYFQSEKTPFNWPTTLVRRTIEELYTILRKVAETVKFAQNDVDIAASPLAAVWRMFLDLYPGNDLMIFNANSEEPTLRCYEDLSEPTKKTLALLREGLEQRFFHRYHPIYALKDTRRSSCYNYMQRGESRVVENDFRFAYVLDFIWMLIPKYRRGLTILKVIKKVASSMKKLPTGWDQQRLAQEHLKNIKNVAWQRARQLAVQHITPDTGAREQPTTSSRTSNAAQGCRTHKRKYQRFNPDLVSEDSSSNLPKASIGTVHEKFDAEVHRYLQEEDQTLDSVGLDDTLKFWQNEAKGHRFPILSRIALAFLGAKASSAGIERDFSPAEDIVSDKRSNLDSWVIEVLMCLKLNYNLLPNDLRKIEPVPKTERDALVKKLKAAIRKTENYQQESETTEMQEEENDLEDLSDLSSNFTDNEQVDELVLPTIQRRASTLGTQSPSKTRKTVQ